MSGQTSKKSKLLPAYKSKREASRLKAEPKATLYTLSPKSLGISRGDCILEVISMSTHVASTVCELPALSDIKPVIGITTLICDTVKCVKSNREAARDLAAHARNVTECIVDRAIKDGASTVYDAEALKALKLALDDIHSYLLVLKTHRERVASWVLANQQKDRFGRLTAALDRAHALCPFAHTHNDRTSHFRWALR
ncbi:hypothetical protein MVEN_01766500 [Mycena venus]|uniref:Uncharacterized protein n=1 Tax=Mycena venus TaxID=2733690 RepID=A0A8H6XMX2_9AGAR|nr:hypothetical protein MVEN_01766500 [Mycena venus]